MGRAIVLFWNKYELSFAGKGKFDEHLSHSVSSLSLLAIWFTDLERSMTMACNSQLDTLQKEYLYNYAKKKEN